MNYLSHFYFDTQEKDPYVILGIALPDLVKAFDKSWNVHPHKFREQYEQDPALRGIAKGWERHVFVDKHFHNSEFFQQGMARLKMFLQEEPFESDFLRPFIIVHIALEQILDSLLITDRRVDVKAFYAALQQIDPNKMVEFLKIGGIANADVCRDKYQWFIETQYLHSYVDTEQLTFALSRIAKRIWAKEITERDKAILKTMFDRGRESFASDYILIFDQIEQAFSREKH